ncbi:HEXXH motif domain-containing protein [Actinophytocola gossypii]|nr:HEXXH motif domain-containing protein [Actinophytocola gossypii]
MMRRLRRAERSRRKLLLRALTEESVKAPALCGPMPSLDLAWELLARVESRSPKALDRMLSHPYTGSWAGYTIRLLRAGIDGVCPLWVHLGHLHALAAAAAIRAGLEFRAEVPVWDGNVMLPSLGMARVACASPFSVAVVGGGPGRYMIGNGDSVVAIPSQPVDGPDWWGIRRVRVSVDTRRFTLRLDDLDPYRGLYEPVPPQRLPGAELDDWRRLIDEACQLIVRHSPAFAGSMPVGLDSLVPKPRVLFRNPSASTGEAFGSAVVGRPTDGAALASTLIHEFQHIVLGGVLHLVRLYDDDPRERIYVPWRDDPRPLSGALQGVYAFFGVAAFWRAVASADGASRRAAFEFAYWRRQSWHTLRELRADPVLTDAGRRFLDGIAERLGPWQNDPVPADIAELAAVTTEDHRAGWRVRHLRPSPAVVTELADAWTAGRVRPPVTVDVADLPPTPVPDGSWSRARVDLVRLALTPADLAELSDVWQTVPGATGADLAYASGRYLDAARGYRAELFADPDRPSSLVGLGLALRAGGPHPAARALLHRPELVRAVHRRLRDGHGEAPAIEDIASWIGRLVSE